MKKKRLIDVEPLFMTQGIFTQLATIAGIPWTTSASILNMTYYGNHSGQKSASPMVRMLAYEHADEKLTATDEQTLAATAAGLYLENWKKQWRTLSFDYDPIANYNMEEHETPAQTTRTIAPAETTETLTPAETTETVTPAGTTTTTTPAETTVTDTPAETTATGGNDAGIYGFNSVDAVGSDTLSASTSYTTDESGTLTTTTNEPETVTVVTDTAGTVKNETDVAGTTVKTTQTPETEEFVVDEERVLTRVGNIGVTTTQQMIQSEREVWTWNFFYDIVFRDLDNLLTLQTY